MAIILRRDELHRQTRLEQRQRDDACHGNHCKSYTDTNLNNGTTYYYVVVANGPGGASGNSPEASSTPSIVVILGLVWTGSASSSWDATTTNWLNGITPTAYADGDNVLFNNSGTSASVVINNAVSPGSVTFTNSTINYTISGSSVFRRHQPFQKRFRFVDHQQH